MKNRPYVKQYDSEDKLMNPIVGEYMSRYPNRKERKRMESIIKKFK